MHFRSNVGFRTRTLTGTSCLLRLTPALPEGRAEGIAEVLKEILSEPAETRYAKGAAARQYVLEHKSNIAQARRIISFLRGQAFEDPHPKR